jgi:hypothetical protein
LRESNYTFSSPLAHIILAQIQARVGPPSEGHKMLSNPATPPHKKLPYSLDYNFISKLKFFMTIIKKKKLCMTRKVHMALSHINRILP